MLRVVIDTNVFVSSFFGGKPRQVIDLWKAGDLRLCVSPAILDEYIEVLRKMNAVSETSFKMLIELFSRQYNLLYIAKTPTIKIVKNDPEDDKFIECAIALNARYIISGDKALLGVKRYVDIEILSPSAFLERQ